MRWQYQTGGWIDAAPVIEGDILYIGSQDSRLYALNTSDGSPRWSFVAESGIAGTAAVTETKVLVGTLDGHVYGVHKASGLQAWDYDAGDQIWTGPTASNGLVYFGSSNGEVYALAENTGALVWQVETGDSVFGGPTVYEDTVFVPSYDSYVYALDAATGAIRWRSELWLSSAMKPTIANGLVYVGSWDDHLYALDIETGELRWNFWAGGNVLGSPAVSEGAVFFGSDDGYVYALDAADGSMRWAYQADDAVESSPVVSEGVVYVGSSDDHLHALDAGAGELLWKYAADDDVEAAVAVSNGVVYFGSHDATVYALSAGPPTDFIASATATPAPRADFTPLSPAELKTRLEFAFGTETHVEGVATVSDGDGTSTVTQSFAPEVIEIFENGHFLLTGSTFQEAGWIPRIFPVEEYYEYIDNEHGGSGYLKSALGYCCERTANGLNLIIRGNQPVSAAMSTVSHEAGHARQAIANPPQSKATPGSHLDALQEAEAYAFEVALARKIGEYTGIRTSVFPEHSGLRLYIDNWREDVRESLTDPNEIHKRAQLILWLAVLHDPELVVLKTELLDVGSLSADSMLALHDRLLRIAPSEAEDYVDGLTGASPGELSGDLNFILGTIDGRIGHSVQFPEFLLNVPVLTLSP
ncbi:MAG: PQQ-binding-like beta-propeller repeat protein [SAR202 cluster bacterium]|nr:PQQ-binding-like beta-propeller repeat protein [SAR202 cluster bacterium]